MSEVLQTIQALQPLTESKDRIAHAIEHICKESEKKEIIALICGFENTIENMWSRELKLNKCEYVFDLPQKKYGMVCKKIGRIQLRIFKIFLKKLVKNSQSSRSMHTEAVKEFLTLWNFWKK